MSKLYGEAHRALQDEFGTRDMADRIEQITCKTEFDEESIGFIETRDMFFLATVDGQGQPTVSYKGGDPGFVKVIDSMTLIFRRQRYVLVYGQCRAARRSWYAVYLLRSPAPHPSTGHRQYLTRRSDDDTLQGGGFPRPRPTLGTVAKLPALYPSL